MYKINAYSPRVGRVQGLKNIMGLQVLLRSAFEWRGSIFSSVLLFGVTFRFNFYFIYFHNLLRCIEKTNKSYKSDSEESHDDFL